MLRIFKSKKLAAKGEELAGQSSQARKESGKGKGGQYSGGSRWNQQAQPELQGAAAKETANAVGEALKMKAKPKVKIVTGNDD